MSLLYPLFFPLFFHAMHWQCRGDGTEILFSPLLKKPNHRIFAFEARDFRGARQGAVGGEANPAEKKRKQNQDKTKTICQYHAPLVCTLAAGLAHRNDEGL